LEESDWLARGLGEGDGVVGISLLVAGAKEGLGRGVDNAAEDEIAGLREEERVEEERMCGEMIRGRWLGLKDDGPPRSQTRKGPSLASTSSTSSHA
jgi:hypothetical protein